jgi:hypothetical protein
MTCVVPKNQPIYQALIDKANSYPPGTLYLPELFKKAAKSVAKYKNDIYQDYAKYNEIDQQLPSVYGITLDLITDVVKNDPSQPQPTTPVTTPPISPSKWGLQATEQARLLAAKNQPKDITTWSNDDAARAAFQERLAASRLTPEPTLSNDTTDIKKKRPDYLKTPIYNSQNPQTSPAAPAGILRRSSRIANKPKNA